MKQESFKFLELCESGRGQLLEVEYKRFQM